MTINFQPGMIVRALAAGKKTMPPPATGADTTDADGEPVLLDLEGYARDLIRERISHRFREHRFERLVEEVLKPRGMRRSERVRVPMGA